MMFVIQEGRNKLNEIVNEFGFFSNDSASAKRGFFLQIGRSISHDSLDILSEITGHFGGTNVSKSTEGEGDDVLG